MKKTFKKHIDRFSKQIGGLGFVSTIHGDEITATADGIYLSIVPKVIRIDSKKVHVAETTVILGNYDKAIQSGVLNTSLEDDVITLINGSYNTYITASRPNISKQALNRLEALIGLNSKIYHSSEYTFYKQIAKQEVTKKESLPMRVIKGKSEVTEVIDILKNTSLPNGWLVQKPKSFGCKRTMKTYEKILFITLLLLLLMRIIVVIYRYD